MPRKERWNHADYVKVCARLVVHGKASVDKPRKISRTANMRLLKVEPLDVHDRMK